MDANEILNNTDPNEIRNIIKHLQKRLDSSVRPPSTVIINQQPSQFPPTPTTTTVVDDGFDYRRYLAVYNHFIGSGTVGYDLGLATSHNGREWVIDTEPVIAHGTSGQWDEITHQFPELLQVDGVLYLYYSGKDTSSWNHFKIGLALSYDGGKTWEKYSGNPILNNNIGWENTNVFDPVVVYDREETNSAKRWKMWYTASSFGQGIGYAYSADGKSWTKSGANPVITLGAGGTWNDTYVQAHAAMRRGNQWILFYGGHDGTTGWKNGIATFTDPESTYAPSSNNPILSGDGLTTTLTANLVAGSVTATVADATVLPVGCPVWIGYATRYLTRVVSRLSSTSVQLEDPAPATIASGQMVRSAAYNSVDITGVHYDDGYQFLLTVHQPDGLTELGVHELTMLGYANDDLTAGYIDYGAGIQIPVAVSESQSTSVTRENWSVVDTYDQEENRHKPAIAPGDMFKSTYDTDNDGVVDNAEAVQGHPASDFAQNAFKTISVAGQTDIVADSPTDTLTVVGSGVTITTDATTDTLTLTVAASTTTSGAGQVTGIVRWVSSGGTTFDLPDVAEYLVFASDNGSIVDPSTYSLSSDRTQIVFDSSITAAHVVTADYIVAQV